IVGLADELAELLDPLLDRLAGRDCGQAFELERGGVVGVSYLHRDGSEIHPLLEPRPRIDHLEGAALCESCAEVRLGVEVAVGAELHAKLLSGVGYYGIEIPVGVGIEDLHALTLTACGAVDPESHGDRCTRPDIEAGLAHIELSIEL